MQTVTTYHILQAPSTDALAAQVQKALADGWQPFGSMSIGNGAYAQPIVMYLPELPKI